MAEFQTKCKCGCKEKNWKIGLFGFFLWYFTDAGAWWFRIGTPWKTLSYSPCQGFMLIKSSLFKEAK